MKGKGTRMRQRGFTNHSVMGAVLLCGAWFAIYLPNLAPAVRLGGWPAWLVIAVYLVGATAGPALLIAIEGDELFGCAGIVVALTAGWLSARIALRAGLPPGAIESVRLCGAALGPMLLYGCFHLAAKAAQRKT
jgi:hypothetical protein